MSLVLTYYTVSDTALGKTCHPQFCFGNLRIHRFHRHQRTDPARFHIHLLAIPGCPVRTSSSFLFQSCVSSMRAPSWHSARERYSNRQHQDYIQQECGLLNVIVSTSQSCHIVPLHFQLAVALSKLSVPDSLFHGFAA